VKGLISFFLRSPLLVNIITILVFTGGYIALTALHREGYPKVDRKRLSIETIFPGAGPEEVELNVTIPLEDSLKGIDGIKEYTSSSLENYSHILVVLEQDAADVEKIKSDIRREVDNTVLPKDITRRPKISEKKVSEWPVMEIGLFSDNLAYSELRQRALDLERILKNNSYVSKITRRGVYDSEVKILLNLDTLNELSLSIEEVIQAIESRNFDLTAGTLKTHRKDIIISVYSKLCDLHEVKNIIIRSNFDEKQVRLEDIAQIEPGFEEASSMIRFNGSPGVSLLPLKKENSDVIKAVDSITHDVAQFMSTAGTNQFRVSYLWDQSAETRNRLGIVSSNAVIGLILVVGTLFIFMNFSNALWTALGIPFAISFSLIFLHYFGISINSVSLLGLIVVMGMVVDDAIIISENCYRHRLLGKSSLAASAAGTKEVAYPVLTTVLTTIVAFIPLLKLKGVMGDFAREIPVVIALVLIGSIVESLFILPSHMAHGLSLKNKKSDEKNNSKKTEKEKKFILFLQDKYKSALTSALRSRYKTVCIFLLVFSVSIFCLFSGKVIKFVSFPSDESTAIYIQGSVIGGQTLAYTSEKAVVIESALSRYSDSSVKSYSIQIGTPGNPENFFAEVHLAPSGERSIPGSIIQSNVRHAIDTAGVFTNLFIQVDSGGPPEGRAVDIQVIGNDNVMRRKIADGIHEYLKGTAGIKDIIRSDEENKKEIKVALNYAEAARTGVQPNAIGRTIRAAFAGVIATTVQTPEEEVEYRVLLDTRYQQSLGTLDKLYVPNLFGKLIPLRALVSTYEKNLPGKINHFNGDRTTIINADIDLDILTPMEFYNSFNTTHADFHAGHPGFRLKISGQAQENKETIDSFIHIGVLVGILIFSILVLLFRSLSQAFIVLLAVPFSFIGIAAVLLTHGMPLSSMALFGLIGLIGVVVNDSLVMVSFINDKKNDFCLHNPADTLDMFQIVCDGAITRLRPILLTTITTVAGLMPTAYGLGGMDYVIMPTTRVIAWGLVVSTMLTLFLIPSLYLIEHSLKQKKPLDALAKLWRKK